MKDDTAPAYERKTKKYHTTENNLLKLDERELRVVIHYLQIHIFLPCKWQYGLTSSYLSTIERK
jgi:hypothetical protein